MIEKLCSHITESASFQESRRKLREGARTLKLHGLAGALKAFWIATTYREIGFPRLVATADNESAEQLRDDLSTIMGPERVRYFPEWEILPYEERSPSSDVIGLRIEALEGLLFDEPGVVVTTARALLDFTIPPDVLLEATAEIKVGDALDRDGLLERLIASGYERMPMVEEMGQLSVRGGILDVFPPTTEHPCRIEFFGDEVESIRRFDLSSQRSLEQLHEVRIPPCREVILNACTRTNVTKRAGELELPAEIRENAQDQIFEGMEQTIALLYAERAALLDYLGPEEGIFLNDPEAIEGEAEKAEKEVRKLYEEHKHLKKFLLPPEDVRWAFDAIREKMARFRIAEHVMLRLSESESSHRGARGARGEIFKEGAPELLPFSGPSAVSAVEDHLIDFGAVSQPQYEGDLKRLREDIAERLKGHFEVTICCDNQGQADRLAELLEEQTGRIRIEVGGFHEGFVFPEAKVFLLNDHEVFSRYRRRRRTRKFRKGVALPGITALARGDFIVHVDHGIGRYRGIETLEIDGIKRDCLLLHYRENDKLYVPVGQLDRVRKYTGDEGVAPMLSKLGGAGWERIKARAKKAAVQIAKDLLELYAERQARPGYAFPPDGPRQTEMEAAFIYEETPDQLTATRDVKKDLERPVPMDRLICGDVGYGKTEVAIRAAFKVVSDGKQVAVLVPTTILAQQHYITFTERLADFPVEVDVLSRFRTPKEQRDILERLKRGKIDIVIGTHRLISKDVEFKELGLVVVDEEQRFGVKHKERLKRFRRMVDVLTMTATPIPRTLHMSLSGARDMSVITTPPHGRQPIHTEILLFDEDKIAEAILREVDRGGQVYFVHNRVQSIDSMAAFLEELLPQVRFSVAHGQMSERELERVMLHFLDKRIDCLISTMIIESGLDIPNVNTMIINRADRFGLSQLYQLRGRVGRSNLSAFAYLIIPPWRSLNQTARKRLRAIEEFTHLGSGFKVAMRDLEIRGAGNILGTEQHGFVMAVGFDLYCRLLEESVRELKGEAPEAEVPEPKIDISVSAFIPGAYISEEAQRVSFYQRLAEAKKLVDVWEIEAEMKDRYGAPPDEVRSLLEVAYVKQSARVLRAATVKIAGPVLLVGFPEERELSRAEVETWVSSASEPLRFAFDGAPSIEVMLGAGDDLGRLEQARGVLQELTGEEQAKSLPRGDKSPRYVSKAQ
ncbi:MAG: transcription-repair coupling factor [Candidatus Latescibacteria bacterium 4484_107]|nr:MAG: transcription-repair coupling factor [Candidatus Latescibacteria bacterium 4484_107]